MNEQNNLLMVWTFLSSERMYRTLEDYADVMGQVGIFNFTVYEDGTITGSVESRLLTIIAKYPNVKWLCTIQNYLTRESVVQAILNNTNGARTKFLSEVQRLITTYSSWIGGIDIDFENCGGEENQAGMKALFEDIYRVVHTVNGKHLNICLPPITGPNASVGGEDWCAYEDYANCTDTMTLMSYAFAWLGSAPGPVSPDWWLQEILNYAISVVPKNKILIGMGAWVILWALHREYTGYGADSGTYYWAEFWMEGQYNWSEFDEVDPSTVDQAYIPIASYFDEYQKICYFLPYVYDFVNANMYDTTEALVYGEQDGREYAVSYTKEWHMEGTYQTARTPVNATDGVVIEDGYVYATEANDSWSYTITPTVTGDYNIFLGVTFPWFNRNEINFSIAGDMFYVIEERFYNIYFRSRGYYSLRTTSLPLTAGVTYTITLSVRNGKTGIAVYGLWWGLRNAFDIRLTAGIAKYTSFLYPMIDINGNQVYPKHGFALTTEVLLSVPDSANIWYDDFRSYNNQNDFTAFWDVRTGSCTFTAVSDSQHILNTSGDFYATIQDYQPTDAHIHVRFNGLGPGQYVGVRFGDYRAYYDYSSLTLRLYNGNTLLNSVALSSRPSGLAMRVRENSIRVYVGTTSKSLVISNLAVRPGAGYVGMIASNGVQITLFRLGSGWWYEPYEQVTMTLTDHKGYSVSFAERPTRSDIFWDGQLDVFRPQNDVDEGSTRDYQFSLDYVFRYSNRITDSNLDLTGGPLTLTIEHNDINIRSVKSYIGDADGFGIGYFEDADVIMNWYNRAIHEFGIRGMCVWALGQEDMRMWERLKIRDRPT